MLRSGPWVTRLLTSTPKAEIILHATRFHAKSTHGGEYSENVLRDANNAMQRISPNLNISTSLGSDSQSALRCSARDR